MNQMQALVHAFLVRHLGADETGWPTSTGIANKWRLIAEEYFELCSALGAPDDPCKLSQDDPILYRQPDKAQVIKELCDLLYVCFNLAEELRIDIEPFFDAVHASNMTKTPAALSPTKKIMKGPDYAPPDIAGMLAELDQYHVWYYARRWYSGGHNHASKEAAVEAASRQDPWVPVRVTLGTNAEQNIVWCTTHRINNAAAEASHERLTEERLES